MTDGIGQQPYKTNLVDPLGKKLLGYSKLTQKPSSNLQEIRRESIRKTVDLRPGLFFKLACTLLVSGLGI